MLYPAELRDPLGTHNRCAGSRQASSILPVNSADASGLRAWHGFCSQVRAVVASGNRYSFLKLYWR